jgi:predicted SprT family Zn-dependent metalloprotease
MKPIDPASLAEAQPSPSQPAAPVGAASVSYGIQNADAPSPVSLGVAQPSPFDPQPAMTPSPTRETYDSLNLAHEFFNAGLFGGTLPACLVTLQRKKNVYGFFAGQRFGLKSGEGATDEIALNPSHFEQRTTEETLSTLVHEMAHQWQQHHGKPSRTGYHNKEWAAKMIGVGLVPSSTGQVGGKQVGQKVSHYIESGGAFDRVCATLLKAGEFGRLYVERWGDEKSRRQREKASKQKAASKTRYSCPSCGLNAWAKPAVALVCGECEEKLEAEPAVPAKFLVAGVSTELALIDAALNAPFDGRATP